MERTTTRMVGVGSRAIRRFREADGTSHARAMAYQAIFMIVSGFVGIVGLASVLGWESLRRVVHELAIEVAPGPSSRLLAEAAQQGTSGAGTAAIFGLGAAFVSAIFAMAQLERSTDRLRRAEGDRPTGERYLSAVALALTGGALLAVSAFVVGGGQALATGFGFEGAVVDVWNLLRWPVGALGAAAAIVVLYRGAPRSAPGKRAVAVGAAVALGAWLVFTGALAVYFGLSGSDRVYGPLLAILALALWSLATSLALHLGFAVAVTVDEDRVIDVRDADDRAARTRVPDRARHGSAVRGSSR